VEQAQRTRILESMAQAMSERGLGGATAPLSAVIARAGVSSGAFHEQFADREACLLAAFELALERARGPVLSAYDAEVRWLDALKAALAAVLRFLEEEPALGRLLVVYSMSGGERLLRRRAQVLAALAEAIDRGGGEALAGRGQPPPAVVAEGLVGAVLAILQNRLLEHPERGVMDLFGSLVSILVLPYLGAGAARRELMRPVPRARAGAGPGAEVTSFGEGSGMRLTYRTARVLAAIGDYPGASNREVAERAGVVDQGQISKLLARLQARGLIAKAAPAQARGAPNSWQLTERGRAMAGGEHPSEGAPPALAGAGAGRRRR